jgi:hypothetical protein
MHRVAVAFLHLFRKKLQPAALAFQAGFHSVPSLVPLHMHVMSRDFDRCARAVAVSLVSDDFDACVHRSFDLRSSCF